MKRIAILFTIILLISGSLSAQVRTSAVMVYKEFRPSIIQLTDGRLLRQPLTNIFLKNSSLVYKSGQETMQAKMANIRSVTFDDRQYVRIDSVLAFRVDSVGNDALYQATVIDMEAYKLQLSNNNQITSLSLGDVIGFTSIDLSNEEDYKFPLVDLFYFKLNGHFIRCHERELRRVLSKEKRRVLRTFVALESFSWTDDHCLMKLLKALQ